jgi:chorismate mutase
MSKLILRSPSIASSHEEQLAEMREKIGILDDRLFDILSARMKISEEVGNFKREQKITILQQEHWEKVISKRLISSEDYELTPQFVRKIMDAIHQESIRHQTKVMNPKNE